MVAVGKPAVFVSDMKIFDVFQFFFMNKGIIDVINAFRVAIHTDCRNTFLAVVFVFDAVINASEMHLVQKFKHTGMVVFSVKVFVPQFVAVKIADNQRVFVQIMSVGFQSFGGVYHVTVA